MRTRGPAPVINQTQRSSFAILLVFICAFAIAPLSIHAQDKITFIDHVLPLVEQHCAKCHNSDKKKGDLDLTSYSGALKGGGTGVAVVAGNPDSSKLIKSLTHAEEPNMPPNKPPLAEKELAVFKKWIAGGLLETSGSKALAAAKPSIDLTLKVSEDGKPDGPPPIPKELSIEPVVHTSRNYAINGLAASPWAPVIAIAGQKQILLYHSTHLELLGILPFPQGQPFDVKFSRSGTLLLAGGGHGAKSGQVVLWKVESGERLTTVGNEYDSVLAADISPDQSKVALGGPDRLVKIFSTKTGEVEHKIKKHTDWVTSVAFSPNGEMLATADRNGGVTVWDADNGQELFTTPGHKSAVTSLSWRSDSKLIASSSEDGTIKLWESSEGKQTKTWNAHSSGALCVAYSRDGRFVSCGRDGAVVTWNSEGVKVKSYEFTGEIALRCAWSDDMSRIVAADFAGNVAVWSAKDGKRLGTLDANPPLIADRLASARKRLADSQARGDQPSPALAAAQARFSTLTSELEAARAESLKIEATFASLAKEVAQLKALASQPNPPADVDQQLTAARAKREKARGAKVTGANTLESKSKELAEASAELEKLTGSNDPKAELAAAQAAVDRLVIAQARTTLLQARESLAARKRDLTIQEAALNAKQEEVVQLTKEISAAKTPAEKSRLKAALKTAQAGVKSLTAQCKNADTDVVRGQSDLEKLTKDFDQQKAARENDRADSGNR